LQRSGNSASLAGMNDTKNISLPEGKDPILRVVPMPADANQHGDIFGGWIMAQVDIAAGVLAARHARGRVVTVAVNEFQFKQPVFIGDVLSFYGEIVRVGNTSITVNVEVYAQRNPSDVETVKVTEATLTYVATGPDRRPRPVPPLPERKG
jgi:acyl-CoA thioesterase YciA